MLQRLRRLMLVAVIVTAVIGTTLRAADQDVASGQKTTLAITVATNSGASSGTRQLADVLATLLESQVLEDGRLSVVERRQIELALQELALNRSRSADESLQLGKLVSADVLVLLELRQPEDAAAKPTALVRVIEAKTAALRGITVATEVDDASLDDVVAQFARYVSATIRQPQTPTITVAVAPFESAGRFDRLRPLELGVRDLITTRLLSGMGLSDAPPFQVLQRSGMDQLLREMDLIHSGFADRDLLPRALPSREAAYLINGEIDERQIDGKFVMVVRGELRHAASGTLRDSFEVECLPVELEARLFARVDQFAKHLGGAEASRASVAAGNNRLPNEADVLKRLALRDLHRFRRISPTDFSHRAFALPGESSLRDVPRLVKADTPLGQSLLRKAIDRLESSLFLHPDDAVAAYALGFCFSIHQPDIHQPERADDLLRRAAAAQPDGELAALALACLSELDFDDRSGQFAPVLDETETTAPRDITRERARCDIAAERLWWAFERTPASFRDHRWPRMLTLFDRLQRTPEQNADLLEKVIPFAEQADSADQAGPPGRRHQPQLAGAVQVLAVRLAIQSADQPELKAKGTELLHRWSAGKAELLAHAGRQGLASISAAKSDFLAAAIQLEESAVKMSQVKSATDRHKRDAQLVNAAKNYRLAKQPERALQLLASFEPTKLPASYLIGLHGYEVGACFEALDQSQSALAAYLRATELAPGIVPNSNIVTRINALGGVPLREDRSIDVRYVAPAGNGAALATVLATDGERLFVGGASVSTFHPETQTWHVLKPDVSAVTAMKIRGRTLWIGTKDQGLWRCELDANQWTSFGTEQGLPDPRVVSLAIQGEDVYAGVGSAAAGGLIRIDKTGTVYTLDDADAPRVAPTHIVVDDKRLLARTPETIHELSFQTNTLSAANTLPKTEKWILHKAERSLRPSMTPCLFAGTTDIWTSNYGRELSVWGADEGSNQLFKQAWYFAPGTKAGYRVHFVAERGDDVWFGGQQKDQFISSGLYCLHRKTGAFEVFSPRDGFKSVAAHSISDGLWFRDQLWLATSQGPCVVTAQIRRLNPNKAVE